MKISYDQQEDAMHIRFTDEPYASSEEVQEGVILDLDQSGAIGGIEFLNVSTRIPHLNPHTVQFEIETHGKS
jgi:uncharacterized protein YuzE